MIRSALLLGPRRRPRVSMGSEGRRGPRSDHAGRKRLGGFQRHRHTPPLALSDRLHGPRPGHGRVSMRRSGRPREDHPVLWRRQLDRGPAGRADPALLGLRQSEELRRRRANTRHVALLRTGSPARWGAKPTGCPRRSRPRTPAGGSSTTPTNWPWDWPRPGPAALHHIAPGAGAGGVGIENSPPAQHFVTFAGLLETPPGRDHEPPRVHARSQATDLSPASPAADPLSLLTAGSTLPAQRATHKRERGPGVSASTAV